MAHDGPHSTPQTEELRSLGLYDPAGPNARERLAALELLVERGATVDDLCSAGSDLGGLAARLALRPGGGSWSQRELAARAEVPLATVRRMRLAAGLPDPGAESAIGNEDDVAMLRSFAAATEAFGEDFTLQLVRVIGAAMTKVADALVSAFIVNIGPAAISEDPGGLALVRANLDSIAFLPMLMRSMEQLLRLHMLAAQRPASADMSPDTGYETQQLTVGFVDLVGSTRLAQRLSTRALAAALGEFEARAADLIVTGGGRVVKLIGDEIMFVASNPRAGCAIALGLVDEFRDHPVLTNVRGSLAVGEVLTRDGDCFGPVVNLAARGVGEADPGTVVVDAETASHVGDEFRAEPIGERSLKGFDQRVALSRLSRR